MIRLMIATCILIGLTGCASLFTQNTTKASGRWNLEVLFPDKEIKRYEISDEEFNIKLSELSWKCSLSKLMKGADAATTLEDLDLKEGLSFRAVTCEKGSEKIGMLALCGKEYQFHYTYLMIEEKTLLHRIILTCDFR